MQATVYTERMPKTLLGVPNTQRYRDTQSRTLKTGEIQGVGKFGKTERSFNMLHEKTGQI